MPGENATIVTACSSCNTKYKVPSAVIGKKVNCKKCGAKFEIKDSAQEPTLPIFGKLAMQYKLINEAQLHKAIEDYNSYKDTNETVLFKDFMVSQSLISQQHLDVLVATKEALDLRHLDRVFGMIAVKNGYTTKEIIESALETQAREFKETRRSIPIGDKLVEAGILSEEQRIKILQAQKRTDTPEQQPAENKQTSEESKPVGAQPEAPASEPPAIEETPNSSDPETVSPAAVDTAEVATEPSVEVKNTIEPHPETPETPQQQTEPETPESTETSESIAGETEQQVPDDDTVQTDDVNQEATDEDVEAGETAEPDTINLKDVTVDLTEDYPKPERADNIVEQMGPFKLTITEDGLFAYIEGQEEIPETLNLFDIKRLLAERNISYGLADDAQIEIFLKSETVRSKPFLIAKGLPPEQGKEGRVDFLFDINPVKVGSMNSEGHIDFKDRGEIPFVKKGEQIAAITPVIQGMHGIDIFNNQILVPKMAPIRLRCDRGTHRTSDGTKVFAKTDGQPVYKFNGLLCVLPELNIVGDVGYKTGHIDFDGHVKVSGTVQSGFNVRADSLTALEVLSSKIELTGDLVVYGGLSGADVNIQGNVKARYINKCKIEAYGDVIAEKEIIDCNIENSGACKVPWGKIISSEISTQKGIETKDIGTEMSKPCKIKVGCEDHLAKELAIIENLIARENQKLDHLKLQQDELSVNDQEIHKLISEQAHLQDRTQIEIRALNDGLKVHEQSGDQLMIDQVKAAIEELEARVRKADEVLNGHFDNQDRIMEQIESLKKSMELVYETIDKHREEKNALMKWAKKQKKIPVVKAAGMIFAGTTIMGINSTKTFMETVRAVRVMEIKNSDPMASSEYEMRLSSI